ncbi:MAG: DALR domain-containing protein, partial [Methylococcaceae bacterium]
TALRGLAVDPNPAIPADTIADSPAARFKAARDDDFNTAEAVAVLFHMAREINRLRHDQPGQATALGTELRRLGGVLGLLQANPADFMQASVTTVGGMPSAEIEALIEQRIDARNTRNWAEADRIRDLLKSEGVVLEDASSGTIWRRE